MNVTSNSSTPKRRVLLISNVVMHYRVSVYNYFHARFAEMGWEWLVLTDELQSESRIPPKFPIEVMPFDFAAYRKRIKELKPDVVILFLHLKDRISWPLIHWLKFSGIPFASWTKTRNLDEPDNGFKNLLFNYVNSMSDALILYSGDLTKFLSSKQRAKSFVANNTVNHNDFPVVTTPKAELKKALGIPFEKVVLFVGRMGEGGRKRIDYLIEMFRNFPRKDVGLVIVGSGLREDWKARIDPRTTLYLGEVHDPENRQIANIFSLADLCVIPGHVGLGLNQALFYGLPVITMEGKQPPEIAYLHHGKNGFIVPAGDQKELERRVLELIDDDGERADFARVAKLGFMHEASIEGMFQGFWKCTKFLSSTS